MDLLSEFAKKYKTDKLFHGFTPIYNEVFKDNRDSFKKVFEIGIKTGASMKMWRDYFKNADIVGLDRKHRNFDKEERMFAVNGNQAYPEHLQKIINSYGTDWDLIIDDGSHHIHHQQISFNHLFKHVKKGGYYIIEDLHTSFKPEFINDEYNAYKIFENLKKTDKLTKNKYLTNADEISKEIESIKIYDVKDDKNHITAIIRKS